MEEHDYDEKNIHTCKRCKEIHHIHGDTDAQIIEPHIPEPMENPTNYNLDYDIPGYDIKNANEIGDKSRKLRLKKIYIGTDVAAPASQIDAFEFIDT